MNEEGVYLSGPGEPDLTREQLLHNLNVVAGQNRKGGLRAIPDKTCRQSARIPRSCTSLSLAYARRL
jgi:hypothetical protein